MNLKNFIEEVEVSKLADDMFIKILYESMIDVGIISIDESVTTACELSHGNSLVTDDSSEELLKKAAQRLLSTDYKASKNKKACLTAVLSKLDANNCDNHIPKQDHEKKSKENTIKAIAKIEKVWNTLVAKLGPKLREPNNVSDAFNKMKEFMTQTLQAQKREAA